MDKIIPGKNIAESIYSEISLRVKDLVPTPRLGIILASDDESSHKYVELKMKKAKELGIETKLYHFESGITKDELIFEIKRFKNNEAIHGLLLQLPLFDYLESYTSDIVNSIEPGKDVDGLTAIQQGNTSHMIKGSILPAAVEAVLECLNYCFKEDLSWNNIQKNYIGIQALKGKNVLILNNSNLVGKPLSQILTNLDATVTLANTSTKNLKDLTLNSDIIVSATGKTNLVDHTMIKEGVILIDVTSVNQDGKVIGDFIQSDELMQKASFITPVPGGVGPLTIACLLRNLVR